MTQLVARPCAARENGQLAQQSATNKGIPMSEFLQKLSDTAVYPCVTSRRQNSLWKTMDIGHSTMPNRAPTRATWGGGRRRRYSYISNFHYSTACSC